MKNTRINKLAFLVAFAALFLLMGMTANQAIAEDDDDDDTILYYAPYTDDPDDPDADLETLKGESGSGFDTPGPFYIDPDDFDENTSDEGYYDPDIPEPLEVEEDSDD